MFEKFIRVFKGLQVRQIRKGNKEKKIKKKMSLITIKNKN